MRLDYQATDITWFYLRYNNFSIESANEEYPLIVGGFTRMGHDAFISGSHNDMKLSTLGKDNDKSTRNCIHVQLHKGKWMVVQQLCMW